MMSQSNLSQAKPVYIITLERHYGGPGPKSSSDTGVYFQILSPGADLEALARQSYQQFLGQLWEIAGDPMFAEWCEVWRRQLKFDKHTSEKSIIEALRQIGDIEDQVYFLLDHWVEEPEAAQAAVISAFDHPSVIDLRVYYLGDADIHRGVLIAGMRENHEATALVLLAD